MTGHPRTDTAPDRVDEHHSVSILKLLTMRRFLPLFATQFLGAFNDNVFRPASNAAEVSEPPRPNSAVCPARVLATKPWVITTGASFSQR